MIYIGNRKHFSSDFSAIKLKESFALNTQLSFHTGFKDGVPIALGYFSVSLTFGMLAVEKGIGAWSPIMISLSNFTGTGQFVGLDLISQSAALTEIAFTLFMINIRYFLMSLSLLQRLPNHISKKKKLLIAFGVTDEVYAVAMQQTKILNFPYLMGLILCSYAGWNIGTLSGTLVSDLLPKVLTSAFGIAIYGMFIAIIVPAAIDSKPVLYIIIMSIFLSCLLRITPMVKDIGAGWILIICGVITSGLGALLFPIPVEEEPQ